MLNFKGMRFPIDIILVCIRWYVAYPLSYRHLEEMMDERGVSVDHSSINRRAIRFLPLIEKVSRKHKLEQDHRAIKRVTRPMLNFKSFRSASNVLAGIEFMHMIRKGQFAIDGAAAMSFADQFYALAGQIRPE
jgi:transposase-like protein